VSAPLGPGGSSSTAGLLLELVNNTLDPGYAEAARRRAARGTTPPARHQRLTEQALAAVGCVLIGLVLVVAYVHEHRAAPESAQVHSALIARVRDAESQGNELDDQERALAGRIDQLRNAALGSAGTPAELAELELLAGTTAAKGPGLRVSLADPPTPSATATNGRRGSIPISAVQVISDRDIRSVVNQLWSDGAEAIAVNNVRLTPTSAIRFAGEAVLVDFEPITSPYVITAIGDSARLDTGFAASSVASRYQTLASADGITFKFDQEDSLSLPASVALTPQYADPIPPTGAPTATATR
jgi:uncharacterized protein YlxW (UPF0749 family)